jgi:hypothetical protein
VCDRDWMIFIAAVILFDALRGLIFRVVSSYDLPVYMQDSIRWEHAWVGGQTLPELLQGLLAPAAGEPGAFDKSMVLIHSTHFLYFFGFGFGL